MREEKVLVFTHMPKTGGITLRSIINAEYIFKKGKSFTFWEVKDKNTFIALPNAEKRRINLIKGHSSFGIHEHIPHPVQYFTMLRDPVKRVISAYNFARTFAPHKLYKVINIEGYSLKQVLQSGITLGLDNCYIRFLCGVSNIPYGEVNEEHLAMALHNLKTYYASVGITEFFNESVLLFAKKFNWDTPYYVKENKTSVKTDINELDEETISLLKFYTRYDEVLYQAGIEIFKKQVLEAGPAFKDEVLRFKEDNKRREWLTNAVFLITSKLRIFDKGYLSYILKASRRKRENLK